MIRGLDIFRENFRSHSDSLVLIGGAACDEWFSSLGMEFRATKDLDIVLILEAVNQEFVATMRAFIEAGEYEVRSRSEGGPPVLYRFAKPTNDHYPAMLELFSKLPEGISLMDEQTIVPIAIGEENHSLSAILVDADYQGLIRDQKITSGGIAFANATALIPLKAKAWLDLSRRKVAGENIDSRDIAKHRADIFRLAATLPGDKSVELTESIRSDLADFLAMFAEESPEWPAILSTIKKTVGGNLKPAALLASINNFFQLK